MIAAIYARKSTEQNGLNDEAKSVTRQIEHATAYAERKGWTVDPRYIFVDDAVSGAEWKHRLGFNALLAALEPRPRLRCSSSRSCPASGATRCARRPRFSS